MLNVLTTLNKPLQFAQHGMTLLRKRWLIRALVNAQYVLGECMYAAGIDDGELGARILALEERIRRAEALGGFTHSLKATHRQLVLQLAVAALEDDGPLPGADAEYRSAREAQAALNRHDKKCGRSAHGKPELIRGTPLFCT